MDGKRVVVVVAGVVVLVFVVIIVIVVVVVVTTVLVRSKGLEPHLVTTSFECLVRVHAAGVSIPVPRVLISP